LDPSKRFVTLVLAVGILVLVIAIALGERMGNRVIGQVTEKRLSNIVPVTVTPAPQQSNAPYGPDWKRSQVLTAAGDPAFPDPRVPPVPLPTAPPRPNPKVTETPKPVLATPTPTPNPNLPIWRRLAPLPTPTPQTAASGTPPTPVPGPSISPQP
jgi:hypothetical protein